ncbi:hypothetical protein RhiirC2_750832, partial [Rhizophagus irregularis]
MAESLSVVSAMIILKFSNSSKARITNSRLILLSNTRICYIYSHNHYLVKKICLTY